MLGIVGGGWREQVSYVVCGGAVRAGKAPNGADCCWSGWACWGCPNCDACGAPGTGTCVGANFLASFFFLSSSSRRSTSYKISKWKRQQPNKKSILNIYSLPVQSSQQVLKLNFMPDGQIHWGQRSIYIADDYIWILPKRQVDGRFTSKGSFPRWAFQSARSLSTASCTTATSPAIYRYFRN